MSDLKAERFDYSVVDDDCRRKLISCAGEVTRQKKTGLAAMLEMGQAIKTANELLANHSGGTFGKWVETECGIAPKSAYRYMHAWESFGSCDSLSQLTAEAVYALSSPNAPPEAAKQAQKLADKGVKVTEKVAKELLAPAEPKPAKKPTPAKPAPEPDEPPSERQWGEGDSLADVQADLEEFAARCKSLNLFGRKILRYVKDDSGENATRPYCGCYSALTLLHPLLHVARVIKNDMPVGGTPKKPVLYYEQKAQEAAK